MAVCAWVERAERSRRKGRREACRGGTLALLGGRHATAKRHALDAGANARVVHPRLRAARGEGEAAREAEAPSGVADYSGAGSTLMPAAMLATACSPEEHCRLMEASGTVSG